MRNVIYSMMVSLDGYVARPDGALDWVAIDEELHTFVNDQHRAFDTYLYGRRTYEQMADFWPTADADPAAPAFIAEFARIWRETSKLVFSRTLESVTGNARLAGEDIAGEVARLKARPGRDMPVGGANLAASFIALGLIDEYRLYLQPVILGGGIPFFPASGRMTPLRLIESRPFASGVVYLRYRRADEGGLRRD